MSNKFEGRSKTFQTCKVSKNVPQALSTEKAVHKQRNTPRKSHEINFWLKMKDWTHASIFTPSRTTKRYKKEIFKNSQWCDSKQKQLIRTEFWWGGMKMFWYWIVVMVVKFQEYDKNHWTDWERAPSSIFHPTSTPSTLFLQMDLLSLLEHIIKKHIQYLPPTK